MKMTNSDNKPLRPTTKVLTLFRHKSHKERNKNKHIYTLLELSEILENHLDWNDDDDSDVRGGTDTNAQSENKSIRKSPVFLFESEDSHLLRCARPDIEFDEKDTASILGILENQSLFRGRRWRGAAKIKEEDELRVQLEVLRPDIGEALVEPSECSCSHLKSDWTRRPRQLKSSSGIGLELDMNSFCCVNDDDDDDEFLPDAMMTVYDLTHLQIQRKRGLVDFRLDTNETIFHLLRSILQCPDNDFHCSSPWSEYYFSNTGTSSSSTTGEKICTKSDQLFGILLCNQTSFDDPLNNGYENEEESSWYRLEKKEIQEIVKFRTGDACPSYYLYSVSKLSSVFTEEIFGNKMAKDKNNGAGKKGITLLIYRHLPPRLHFHDKIDDCKASLHPGCLIEEMKIIGEDPGAAATQKQFRVVAPPYQSHNDIYGDLLQNIFMNPENLECVVNEAMNIPQWTAWPERNHYQSEYDNDSDVTNSAYPASWTVFPLCHTFPASDVTARKWITKTCAFVPQTTSFLKALGPVLRTALFSRLEPHTTLGSHTGWADLANHVLRVHIPLVVPFGGINDGLCGTWVDGCVETHAKGKIICFDDSKTHRAFNYSNEERIVLIIDLARPTDEGFPDGTASGGHTNELDKFIKQFS